jgi:hypothetical protein
VAQRPLHGPEILLASIEHLPDATAVPVNVRCEEIEAGNEAIVGILIHPFEDGPTALIGKRALEFSGIVFQKGRDDGIAGLTLTHRSFSLVQDQKTSLV